jgi:riboflavin biosynthesis pyrimidine reductase
MRQLLPSSELGDPDLARLYAYPSGRWLRANMVSSADGAAILEGVTAGLSSRSDRHLFSLLRALADVIVVGAATARAEKYGPARQREFWNDLRKGRPPTPPIAVVSARLDLDPASRLIAAAPPHARTIVITTAQSPPDRRADLAGRADVIVAGDQAVDLNAAVSALDGRGYQRMLTEGGPRLLGQFIAAGLLDELCLTIGPLLAGPGASGIVAGALSASRPMPLELAHVLEDSGFLLCRYIRKDHLSERAVVRRSGQVSWPCTAKPKRPAWRHPGHDRRSCGDVRPTDHILAAIGAANERASSHGLAAGCGAHAPQQFVRRGVFQQVAGGASFDRRHHVGVGIEGGEHEDPRADATHRSGPGCRRSLPGRRGRRSRPPLPGPRIVW